jgi:hypothetical protein
VAVSMAVHPRSNWAAVAASSGIVTIWDLRFALPVRK